MSDTIVLWDPRRFGPEPTNFEEAAGIYVRLAGVKDEPNDAFAIFAQRIQSHVQINLCKDETLMHMFGRFLDVAHACRSALFVIEMPGSARDELLRLMLMTSSALGLVLFDERSGLALTKSNFLKAASRQQPKAGASDSEKNGFPTRLSEFRSMARPALNEFFLSRGFEKRKMLRGGESTGVLERKVGELVQRVLFWVRSNYGKLKVYVLVEVDSPDVISVWAGLGVRPRYSAVYFEAAEVFFRRDKSVASWMDWDVFMRCLDEKLIPVLEKIRDIRSMDAVVNGEDFPEVVERGVRLGLGRELNALIIARLAANPDFANLTVTLRESYIQRTSGEARKADLNEFNQLAEYLSSVEPVVVR